jgi:hypothetical protein
MGEMPAWLDRLFSRPGAPALRGAPAARRLKTYRAASGYVYHYYYLGFREAGLATEHMFETSGDRKEWFLVSVAVEEEAVRAWEAAHGRELNATERYAAAKMALFAAFDERARPVEMRAGVRVTAETIEGALGPLDLGA